MLNKSVSLRFPKKLENGFKFWRLSHARCASNAAAYHLYVSLFILYRRMHATLRRQIFMCGCINTKSSGQTFISLLSNFRFKTLIVR